MIIRLSDRGRGLEVTLCVSSGIGLQDPVEELNLRAMVDLGAGGVSDS